MMAVRTRFEIKGVDEYLEKLRKAGQDIDAVADRALAAGGEILAEGMRRRVPKDTHNLEKHIGVTAPAADGNVHYVEVGVLEADADTARYGNVQEFGAATTPAQPYIRPTIKEDWSKARKAMKQVIVDAQVGIE
jgi:HK97 gp10 family phage protein